MTSLSELYQSRESIFGLPLTEYPQIEVIQKMFEQYATLWRFCSEFMRSLPEWMDGPFPEINAETVANECDKWWRGTAKLSKVLEGPALEVVQQVRVKMEEFQQHIPLITAMRNPGLRDRHWNRISAAVGFPVKADAGFSVSRALQLGLPKFMSEIEEVSEYASKEYSLERTLDKMQGDWSGVRFESMVWRSTGTYILRALDDIQMLLDDQIVKTQSMRASPYIGPFEERVGVGEVWGRCGGWGYSVAEAQFAEGFLAQQLWVTLPCTLYTSALEV